jgi:hypothetical protein
MILNGLKLAIKYGKIYYTINSALSCPGFWSIFKPSGIAWRLGKCDQTDESIFKPNGNAWQLGKYDQKSNIFKPSGNRLATRKMRPNQNLAHVG